MKKSILVLILFLIVIVSGVVIFFTNKTKVVLTDAKRFSEEYESVSEDNIFIYKDIKEIINILKHGSGIVYLGFPECPWCQAYVPMLNEVAKENLVEKIYYFDILEERRNNTYDYQKIVEILKDYLQYDDEGNKRVYVPSVIAVLNGKIVGFDDETSVISENIEPKDYWSIEKKDSLKNKLKIMINSVTNNTCTTCNK